jgi:hypothetical protein
MRLMICSIDASLRPPEAGPGRGVVFVVAGGRVGVGSNRHVAADASHLAGISRGRQNAERARKIWMSWN